MSKKSSTFAAENKIKMLMETEIKFDQRNYRKHSKKNKELIRKSLVELGAGRSVVIDNENELVAGNGVYEQAQALKMPVRIVETDGSELVVVKRTDLATQDDKRKKLALADNSASDTSEFDKELLTADWAKDVLKEWGVTLPDSVDYEGITAAQVMDAIVYRPSETPASIDEFVDDTLYDKVKEAVGALKVPKELRAFVQLRLNSFRRFRFDKIADYYARADEETQKVFRQLALVFDIRGTSFEKDILDFYSTGLSSDENAYD